MPLMPADYLSSLKRKYEDDSDDEYDFHLGRKSSVRAEEEVSFLNKADFKGDDVQKLKEATKLLYKNSKTFRDSFDSVVEQAEEDDDNFVIVGDNNLMSDDGEIVSGRYDLNAPYKINVNPSEQKNKYDTAMTIVHEIGHIILGLEHNEEHDEFSEIIARELEDSGIKHDLIQYIVYSDDNVDDESSSTANENKKEKCNCKKHKN